MSKSREFVVGKTKLAYIFEGRLYKSGVLVSMSDETLVAGKGDVFVRDAKGKGYHKKDSPSRKMIVMASRAEAVSESKTQFLGRDEVRVERLGRKSRPLAHRMRMRAALVENNFPRDVIKTLLSNSFDLGKLKRRPMRASMQRKLSKMLSETLTG